MPFCPVDGQVLHDQAVPADPLVGTMVADRYLVEKRLGMGGMGVVYLAQHVYMGRHCALKVLRQELLSDGDAIKRFIREAKNASRIAHPNVAAIYDFGRVSNGQMYLAMEYVDGETLSSVLARQGTLPVALASSVIEQVAKGVQAAHDLGITHRDLKPDNIMLSAATTTPGTVKVVDFGIARMAFEEAQQVTASVMVIGTPAYMSPEQISGSPIDGRSDTYALALVTYAMLTGKLPFNSSDLDIRLRFLQEPKTLSELNPGVVWPDELQAVLKRALSPHVDDRQQSIQEFGVDVGRILSAWSKAPAAAPSEMAAVAGGPGPSELTTASTLPSGPLFPVSSRRHRTLAFVVAGATMVVVGAATVRALRGAHTPVAEQSRTTGVSAASSSRPSDSRDSVARDGAVRKPQPAPPATSRQLSTEVRTPARRQRVERDAVAPAVTLQSDTAQPRSQTNSPTPASSVQSASTSNAPPAPMTTSAQQQATPTNPAQPPLAVPDSVNKPVVELRTIVRIGTPHNQGAELFINGNSHGVLNGAARDFPVQPGVIELRLHVGGCEDWDTTLTARPGMNTIGIRNPKCRL